MFNFLLDKFPKEYMGYEIRTNFTIGIKLSIAMLELSTDDKKLFIECKNLLFRNPSEVPNSIVGGAVSWFLKGGATPYGVSDEFKTDYEDTSVFEDVATDTEVKKVLDEEDAQSFDFRYDSSFIYSAFKRYYPSIDLQKDYIHWWEFLVLLSDVGECSFTRIKEFRTIDMKGLSKEQKKFYREMKGTYKLPPSKLEIEGAKLMYGEDWRKSPAIMGYWYSDILK